MKSVMTHKFDQTPKAEIPRSSFDLSHGYKTTFDGGLLVPFLSMEALPGDTINLKTTALARLATPIKPIMDNMFLETFFFSVPMRQVWDNWEKFNGEQENPGDSTDYVIPILSGASSFTTGDIAEFLGLPLGTVSPDRNKISCLYHRAYHAIYNNWFRNQNLVDSIPVSKGDGPDDHTPTIYKTPQRRSKKGDYFTSCLPFPQKGPPVTTPIGDSAPISGIGTDPASSGNWNVGSQAVDETLNSGQTYSEWMLAGASPGLLFEGDGSQKPAFYANLAAATGVNINDLRQSFQIQKLLERDARGGTRYPEVIKSHFGVTDPQMLVLQRPEFLGGGSVPLNIQPVQQTGFTATDVQTATTPQGNLAAYGTASVNNHGFTKSFTEHCIIIGIVNVRADLTYQQGINRKWSRQTRYDFFWPALQNIGEQAVLNQEIYAVGSADQISGTDHDVFGYQERYGEYRFQPSLITGEFRSQSATPLDIWHLSQDFGTLPTLDKTFIEDNPPIDRISAVPSEPHFLLDAYFNIRAARPMALYGVPGLIDHF